MAPHGLGGATVATCGHKPRYEMTECSLQLRCGSCDGGNMNRHDRALSVFVPQSAAGFGAQPRRPSQRETSRSTANLIESRMTAAQTSIVATAIGAILRRNGTQPATYATRPLKEAGRIADLTV